MCNCAQIFANKPADFKQFVEHIVKNAPDSVCENCNLSSALQPTTLVDNTETIARIAFHPFHYDNKTKKLTEKVVSDAFDKGLSGYRKTLTSDHEITQKALLLKNEKRQPTEIVTALAEAIRSISDLEDRKAFAIYNTDHPKNVGHVDVCVAHIENMRGSRKTDLQDELFQKFSIERQLT